MSPANLAMAPRSSMPVETSDLELIEAARGGDHAAFATLYNRHARWVFARLTRLVGPGHEREDLLQQVFLELHRSLSAYRGEAALRTFLHRITVHVAFDHLRRRGRRPVAYAAEALDELIDGHPTPEERARRRDELRQVLELLERLKPVKRIAFVLVAVEGLSLDDAAAIVGANTPAVKQRVLHARRELVELVERAERDDQHAARRSR